MYIYICIYMYIYVYIHTFETLFSKKMISELRKLDFLDWPLSPFEKRALHIYTHSYIYIYIASAEQTYLPTTKLDQMG